MIYSDSECAKAMDISEEEIYHNFSSKSCTGFIMNETKEAGSILESKVFPGLAFIVISLVLVHIVNRWVVRRKSLKDKLLKTKDQRECLGYDDLPVIKSWIPWKLIGNVPQFFPLSGLSHKVLKWSEEHGDVFTGIGLNQRFVVLNSGPSIQALMKSADFGHVMKAPVIYNPMKPFITNGVLVSKGAFWQNQRKILMKTQSFQSLKSYIPMLESHSKRMVENLQKLFQDGSPHEVNTLISTTFLGIISEMITGRNLENPEELEEYHHNFSIWKEVMFKRILNPLLLLKPIWIFHPLYEPHENALKGLFDFAKRRLEEHKELSTGCHTEINQKTPNIRSMLDELVNAGVDEKQIVDEINTMMFGGHETGACTIHFLLFCLALNPEIQMRARQEVDEIFDRLNGSEDDRMTYEFVQANFKYLERCILETLRLFPPVFAMARKLESPLELEYDNKPVIIPEGASIFICPFILHRRKDFYPDPETFKPERFLPEESAKRHAYSFIPFSGGPRSCLGRKFAVMELKIMAAYILRHFELTTTDRLEDIPLLPYTTITPAKDFTFQMKRRPYKI